MLFLFNSVLNYVVLFNSVLNYVVAFKSPKFCYK